MALNRSKDDRRVLTWSLNAGSTAYINDLEKYSHKIYSIGLHEFGVTGEGKIYDFRSNRNYFNTAGDFVGQRFPIVNENDMINYPSIKWFHQFVLFGWNKVKPVLQNTARNSEGRLPQDQFIYELDKVLDLYEGSRNSGTPLNASGIEMDVEATMTSDPYSQGFDAYYVEFLEKIKNEVLLPRGLELRVNAHAMTGHNNPYYYRFHNYKLFANSRDNTGKATIDNMQLMTYDFAWAGSSPGASTPIWWFRDVAEWADQNFNPENNPDAAVTMDSVFFGSAGYGHRWPMNTQESVTSGSVITYRNLLGWQNGLYKHYERGTTPDGQTRFDYNDQDYIFQASVQDQESKNEIMYPHIYDMFAPRYGNIKEKDGGQDTLVVGTYTGREYATSYFKDQDPKFTGIKAIANRPASISGKAYPNAVEQSVRDLAASRGIDVRELPDEERQKWDKNLDPESLEFQHALKSVNDQEEVFVGWYTENRKYRELYNYDEAGNVIGASCTLESNPDGRINYNLNIDTAGKYRLIAVTNFSWFTQDTLGGYINGSQKFNIGGNDIPEWYPFYMNGTHFYDAGSFNFNSGTNTVSIHGELTTTNTPIYGFIVCQDFDLNFSGGEMTLETNVLPFTGKDGEPVETPAEFALAVKMLRRDARPVIMWDDEFRTYGEGQEISGTSYYQQIRKDYKQEGAGTYVEQDGETNDGQPIFKCYSEPRDLGYTQGLWTEQNKRLHTDLDGPGQLILNKKWNVNLAIDATVNIVDGESGGIRFYAQKEGTAADGYIFQTNFDTGNTELILENNGSRTVIASQPIVNVTKGRNVVYTAYLHNGIGHFFINGVRMFVEAEGNPVSGTGDLNKVAGEITLQRTSGAAGIYGNNAEVTCTHLGIGTTERWETLEKFEVEIDGQSKEYGRINRTGYTYDEYGYLEYSGLNEVETRDAIQPIFSEDSYAVSLDYEYIVIDQPGWEGRKDVTIKLKDAGVWFGELLIGDKEGMSIIWAGDAWSFLDVMNIAVSEYGAKGIGLWTMGQQDPKVFDLIPDVVPKETTQ